MSNRPDWCPADVWAELSSVAARALDEMPSEGPQMRSHRIENIVRAILAERKRCAQILLTKHENHPQDGVNWDGTYYDLYEEILGVPR